MARPKKSNVYNPIKYIFAIYLPFFLKAFWTQEIDIPLVNKRGSGDSVLTLADPLIPYLIVVPFVWGLYFFAKKIHLYWRYIQGFEAKAGILLCVPFSLMSFVLAFNLASNFIIFVCAAVGAFGVFALELNASNET